MPRRSYMQFGQVQLTLDQILAKSAVIPETGCWLWLGPKGEGGYAIFGKSGRVRLSRYVWSLKHGCEMPEGFLACHTCDNPPCVNPDHIYSGTASDNAKDAWARTREAPRRVTQTLSDEDAAEIKRRLPFQTRRSLAREFRVSHATINMIAWGKRFKDVDTSVPSLEDL